MASTIRHTQDFWSGTIFIGFGCAALYLGQDLQMGTAARMGPAYFPMILGAILALIGVASVLRSLTGSGDTVSRFTLPGIVLVVGSTALFGLVVRGAGLPAAIVVLVLLSGLAAREYRFIPFLLMAVSLAFLSTIVFVNGLGLPMPVVGSWFGG